MAASLYAICTSRMYRSLRRSVSCTFCILLLFTCFCWTYTRYLEIVMQEEILEGTSNDIEATESNPLATYHTPESIQQKHENDSLHVYDPEHQSVEELKQLLRESIQQKHENDSPQVYDAEQQSVEDLKLMLQDHALSKDIEFEEDFLRAYLTSTSYHIDRAFTKIQNLLNLRETHSYFFRSVTFDFTLDPNYRFITKLPHRREDGSTTILVEIGKWDPDKVPLIDVKQIGFMIFMQALRDPVTQASGMNVIYDLKDVGWRYREFCKPEYMHLHNHVLYDCFPAKYIEKHITNGNFLVQILFKLIDQFIPEFIRNILHIHASGEELVDFFHPTTLPVKYGGTLKEYYMADWLRKANQEHDNFPAGGQKNIS